MLLSYVTSFVFIGICHHCSIEDYKKKIEKFSVYHDHYVNHPMSWFNKICTAGLMTFKNAFALNFQVVDSQNSLGFHDQWIIFDYESQLEWMLPIISTIPF